MSCNITAGIAKGCNDQVGGISGIHYTRWYDDLVFEKDANGVVVRVYRDIAPIINPLWYWVEADNGLGNLTETYNVGGTGNILGFNQSLNFFIPTTATPSVNNPTQSLENWVKIHAAQNNMLIGVELEHHQPIRDYSGKSFLMGQQRPAYTNSGNKQTGVAYGDDNGYTIEWAANSKEPMNEMAYMVMHTYNLIVEKQLPNPTSTDYSWTTSNFFSLEPLVTYEGGNIRELFPNGPNPSIYVMPGELLTVEALITMDWNANAFSGTTFLPEWEIFYGSQTSPLSYITTTYPLPTVPGQYTVQVKGTFENTGNTPIDAIPLKMVAPTGVDVSGGAVIPSARFLTITRTT